MGRARPARSRRVSSEDLVPCRLVAEPFTLFLGAGLLGNAPGKEFIQRIAGTPLRLHDQPASMTEPPTFRRFVMCMAVLRQSYSGITCRRATREARRHVGCSRQVM